MSEYTVEQVLNIAEKLSDVLETKTGVVNGAVVRKMLLEYADTLTKPADSRLVTSVMVEQFKAAFAEHSTVSPEYDGCIRAGLEAAADIGRVGEEVGRIIDDAERMGYMVDTAVPLDTLREVRATLAEQGQGEAVAKVRHFDYRGIARNGFSQEAQMLDGAPVLPDGTPLYTRPAPAASPDGVPDGWALVPREPTDAMLNAFMTKAEARNPADTGYAASKRWAATLAAAPSEPEDAGEAES